MQRPRLLTGLLLGAPLAVTLVLALLVTQLSGPFTAQVGGGSGQCDITEFAVPTQNGRPYGVTTGPDGNVWFTEFGGNKIGKITPSGVITEYNIPTPNSEPFGITDGPDGNLWFTEQTGNKIGKITPSGVITEYSIPTAGRFPRGITAGPDGNLWFAEQVGGIGRITVGGVITEYALPSGGQANIITAGTDGNLWFTVVLPDKIGKITPSGQITEYPIPGTYSTSFGITAGPDGNLWFIEAQAREVGKITTGGAMTEYAISGATSDPWEITNGPDGNLWFTVFGGNAIGKVTTSGVITLYQTPSPGGSAGRAITTGSDGNLWYALETGNKIVKFNPASCASGTTSGDRGGTPTATTCATRTAQAVRVDQCSDPYSSELCNVPYYKDVTFGQPFINVPKVLVTPNHVAASGGCAREATDAFVCRPENITKTGFRIVCAGSPIGNNCAHEGLWVPADANWIATEGGACIAQGGHQVTADACNAQNVGGLCSGDFTKRVNFTTPYAAPPHVLVAPEYISNQGGCVGGATDKIVCLPRDIDASGFTLLCRGSPVSGSCEPNSGLGTVADGGWIAMEGSAACNIQSKHGLETTECPVAQSNNTCAQGMRKTVTFDTPFAAVPQVIVSPENVTSGHTSCASGATDTVFCEAQNITKTGFTAVCWGSPKGTNCGAALEDQSTSVLFGYLAIDTSCPVPPGGPAQCNDSQDNDGDGLIDTVDPGCADANDTSEAGEVCKTPKILFYNMQAGNDLTADAAHLQNAGYTVTIGKRNEQPTITTSYLQPYDVLWLYNGCGGATGLLTQAEIDAIRSQYLAGKHLVLVSDDAIGDEYQGAGTDCHSRVNQIANQLGVNFSDTLNVNGCLDVSGSHPLLSNGGKKTNRYTAARINFLGGSPPVWCRAPEIVGTVSDGSAALGYTSRVAGQCGGAVFVPAFETFFAACNGSMRIVENFMGAFGFHRTCPGGSSSSRSGGPDVCEPICGDGVKIPPEECDDGNTRNGDGCSDTCKKETGSSSSTSKGSSTSGSSTSKSASSTTTSRSSASSTTSRSSGSSRSIIDDCRVLGNLCAPNAAGFRDCRAQNKACQQTSEDPCYTCVSDIICPADVCKPNGPGEKLCKAQGKTCRRLDEYPCIACDGEGICPADACAVGGQKYCELLGNNICTSKQDGICIDCTSNCRPGGCSDRGGAELCAARQQSCRDTSSGQCIECYPDTYVCSNTYKECKQGGDRYCAADGGKICEPSANQPCIRCVTPPLCPDDACALGGTPYCAKFGDRTCSPKQDGICIDCEGDEPIVCQGSGCRDGGAKLCGNRGLGCRNTDDPATLCVACSTDPSCRDSSECERGAECRSGACVQLCGNRRVDPGEACDGTRGCTADCRLEDNQQCAEDTECRTGLCIRNVCVPCTQPAQCQSNRCNQGECELLCGNGRIDPGETCDGGPAGSPYCTSNCLRATGAVCEEGKECQSNLCRDNACVTCRRNNECASNLCVSGACVTNCGDGRRQPNEQCDDGNRHSGDGCSRFCEIEEGVAAELLPLRLLGEVSGEIDQTPLSPEELAGIRGAATGHPAAGETGPAAVAVIAAGAAAGWSWMRRRRR